MLLDVVEIVVGREWRAVGLFQSKRVDVGRELCSQLLAHLPVGFVIGLARVGVAKEPFIGHVGMAQVGDRTIAHAGQHVVALTGSSHCLQVFLVGRIVACCTHQGRHRAASRCAVGDDFFGIAWHFLVEVAQIADGGFQVENCRRRLAVVYSFSFLGDIG